MDEELRGMLNVIVEGMGRMENRMSRRMDEHFDIVEKRLDNLESEVRSVKISNGTIELLIKKIDSLESRIVELEKRTA